MKLAFPSLQHQHTPRNRECRAWSRQLAAAAAAGGAASLPASDVEIAAIPKDQKINQLRVDLIPLLTVVVLLLCLLSCSWCFVQA
jgi:hypothetical protein